MQAAWVPVSHAIFHGQVATLQARSSEKPLVDYRITYGSQSLLIGLGESGYDRRIRVASLGDKGERLLVVIWAIEGHSGGPASAATVFRRVAGRLKEIATIPSKQEIRLIKLGRDKDALERSYKIGTFVAPVGQVPWPELFRISGNHAVQIRYSPSIYKPLVDDILSLLKSFPDDESAWGYLGLALKFSGQHLPARTAFKRMEWHLSHAKPYEQEPLRTVAKIRARFKKIADHGAYPEPKYHPNF